MIWRFGLLKDRSARFFQPAKKHMTNYNDQNYENHHLATKLVLEPQAAIYTPIKASMSDESLKSVEHMIVSTLGNRRHTWSIDLGTHTGFTAFTLAGISNRVIASDPTGPILCQAKRLGQEQRIANLHLSQNTTEALPFADESIDLVSSRVSAHHFKDFKKVLQETNRVLKNGGSLVVADSIAPEQNYIANWMNDIELRQDGSHVENLKISTIRTILTESGFSVANHDCTRIYHRFNEWTAHTNVSSEEVESLRKDFLNAPNKTREAFHIAPVHGDITFSWPCWVYRAIKQ